MNVELLTFTMVAGNKIIHIWPYVPGSLSFSYQNIYIYMYDIDLVMGSRVNSHL